MDAIEAILTKRDTRDYRPDPIDEAALDRVLQAARMAGSAKNGQLTRIVAVTDPDVRGQLTGAGDFTSWIDRAAAVLVFVVPVDGGRLFDIGRMAQNAMVAANALGLASCAITFHHQDVIRKVLGVPDDLEGPMGITLGHPAPPPADRLRGARVPLDELVHRDHWRP
ncbi:MAG: nitroreductase family protein [Actinomycetota bacterium]|nr:nitroreductase family protein [Actinomycetota bacterium]